MAVTDSPRDWRARVTRLGPHLSPDHVRRSLTWEFASGDRSRCALTVASRRLADGPFGRRWSAVAWWSAGQGLGIVVLCPFRSRWAESEGGQGPGGVPGVVAAGGGDAGVPGYFQDPDAEVAQGSHGLGPVAGADLGGVFAVADVADMVQYLDLPVAAYPGGELGPGQPGGRPGW
jgi:hypothetical protein